MQSNAFSRSQNIPPTINLLFMAFRISIVTLKVALYVFNFVPNPHCSVLKMLCLVKHLKNSRLHYILENF